MYLVIQYIVNINYRRLDDGIIWFVNRVGIIWFVNRVGVETLYRLMGELGVKPDHEVITLVSS